ncbi:hypothetical protein [Massilia sp. ST3]|uniref:hypothetical protein n=1 Tax=Massilia sp. ST3 TaxID=2824903 RepID=UPI001B82DB6A|nr:hypothetical protein [Massilia sp. ST3]MBQ5949919.1 hypothetical protein [Massilia sp. ST3]
MSVALDVASFRIALMSGEVCRISKKQSKLFLVTLSDEVGGKEYVAQWINAVNMRRA